MNGKYQSQLKVAACVAGLAFALNASSAKAIDKLYDPYVNKGEVEIEYSGFRTSDTDKAKNNEQAHELEFGYAFTDYWELELTGGFDRSSDQPMKMDSVEAENKFQITQPGEMWMDVGALVTYVHALHVGDPDSIEAKLLLQKDFGKFSSLANIGLEQGFGNDNDGGPDFTVLWNNRYRLNEYFQPGIEIQSDFGKTNVHEKFNDQEHYVGPSAYGKLFGGNGYGDIGYEAAYLFGVTGASPNSAARLMLEYETHF